MSPRAVIALGIGQCVNWGVLYYAFAVFVLPLQRELGVTTWVVTGALSLALLMSAALAPTVGQWGDRGRGPLLMQVGGFVAAALLAAWTAMPSILALYVVWGGLGLCMAATLYEPAFVIVGRAYDDPVRRLRALAAVTLFGGLASTVFLPATAFLVGAASWRGAVLVLAVVLVGSTVITRLFVFRHLPAAVAARHHEGSSPRTKGPTDLPHFRFVATLFALASLATVAFTTNLVPALGERGVAPSTAAMLGGLIGVMQLPGRALLMNGAAAGSPTRLLAISLLLQATGFGGVAFARSALAVGGGTMIFALGAGLMTLVRPYLVLTMFDSRSSGHLNGRIARLQQLARAAGPLTVAWMAGQVGYSVVFASIAFTFAILAMASHGLLGSSRALAVEKQRHD